MRKNKAIIYILTVLFLCLAGFLTVKETQWDGSVAITARIPGDSGTEEVKVWEHSYGYYFLFLPGHAELSQIRLYPNARDASVTINGQALTDGMTCQDLPLGTPLTLTYTYKGATYDKTLTVYQSGNVPTLYVDVTSGSMERIHADRTHDEPGTLRLYTADGQLDYSGNLDSVDGRGQSTWPLPKKPYNLTLSREADLLGMGSGQNWVLLANYNDDSHLKNKIVYDFAASAGLAYAPASAPVDLYLNGEYAGLYLLCERIEVSPQRVELTQPGSFLVCQDLQSRMEQQGKPHILLNSGAALRIHYSDVSDAQLQQIWQSAENAILSPEGIDPVTGRHWQELIDMDSWARKYLLEEVFGNTDAPILSQYFYRNGSGAICAGPVWDYDLAMPTADPANMLYVSRPCLQGTPWFHALYQNRDFYRHVTVLYQTEFLPLMRQLLEGGLDRYAQQVAPAARMNQIRWGGADPTLVTGQMYIYLMERTDFLTALWLEEETFCTVALCYPDGHVAFYALRPGECLPQLRNFPAEDTRVLLGWYDTETDTPFDITQPIHADMVLSLKYEEQPA